MGLTLRGLPAVIAAGVLAGFASIGIAAEKPVPAAGPAEAAAPAEAQPEAPAAEVPSDAAGTPAEAAPADGASADPAAAPDTSVATGAADAAPPPAAVPEKAAAAPSPAAAPSITADLVLGSPVVGADGKEVGKLNRVRTGADGAVAEIHVKTGDQTIIAVPGNNVASGGPKVTLTVSSGDVAKLAPIGGNG